MLRIAVMVFVFVGGWLAGCGGRTLACLEVTAVTSESRTRATSERGGRWRQDAAVETMQGGVLELAARNGEQE